MKMRQGGECSRQGGGYIRGRQEECSRQGGGYV